MNSCFKFNTTAAYKTQTALKTMFELMILQVTYTNSQFLNQFYFFKFMACKERTCVGSNELFAFEDIKTFTKDLHSALQASP